MEVRISCETTAEMRAGQFVTLVRSDGLARSYSIASITDNGFLLHVRKLRGGAMSNWLHEQACIGETVTLIGPAGECFYVPGNPDQPLLLAGTGTGLAPLYGIVRDALRHGHRGAISIFHGAVERAGLYLVEELKRLSSDHPQVVYIPAVLRGDAGEGVAVGPLDEVISKALPKLNGWRGYVCGDPGIVTKLKKKMFLSGMASREIFADPFVPASPAR